MVAMRVALMWVLVLFKGGLATLAAQGAKPVQGASFDVTVVRLSKPDVQNSTLNLRQDQLQVQNLTLQSLIQFAYKLSSGSDDQIIGGPKWMKTTRFDMEAKMDAEAAGKASKMTGKERLDLQREMLKSLLADRFQMEVHHETRTLPVVQMQAIGATKLLKFEAPANTSGDTKAWQGLRNDSHGHVEGRGADLKMLASVLAFQPEIGGRLVIDQTGLPSDDRFTFDLRWTPEKLAEAQGGGPEDHAVSLFTAVQEELGLKLTAAKAPVDVVVIDRIKMPDEN